MVANPNDPTTVVVPKPLFNKDGRLEPAITILGMPVSVRSFAIDSESTMFMTKCLVVV